MATKKEIKEHLALALKEIGEIEPWFDEDFNAWIFSHKKYPSVEYAGESRKEVIKNYPKYLYDFLEERLKDNLAPHIEKATKGHGGRRKGAGRPKGTKKEPTKRINLPKDVAEWFELPDAVPRFRQMIAKPRR